MSREHGGPDIGKMISEELEGYKAPEQEELSDIKDERMPAERAASMDKADRERKADAEISELRAKWDAQERKSEKPAEAPKEGAKKDVWEAEKKALAGKVAEVRKSITEAKDENEAAEASKALLSSMIEQAVRQDANLGTEIIKTALALPEFKGQAFDEGLKFVTSTLVDQKDYVGQLETLLKGPQTEDKIVAALQKRLPEKIGLIRKGAEQKAKQLRPGAGAKEAPDRKVISMSEKRKEKTAADKKKATSQAMQPFFKDVGNMLKGSEKKSSAPKKERSWLDKLLGRDAA